MKSDLSKQWSEVLGTHKRLIPITRGAPVVRFTHDITDLGYSTSIPLVALGLTGWQDANYYVERAKELLQQFKESGRTDTPIFMVVSLDPPTFAYAHATDAQVFRHEPERRGMALANLWMNLAEASRQAWSRGIPAHQYMESTKDPKVP
jgi:hypothetical protein